MATKEEVEKIAKETKYQKGVVLQQVDSEVKFSIEKLELYNLKDGNWTIICHIMAINSPIGPILRAEPLGYIQHPKNYHIVA